MPPPRRNRGSGSPPTANHDLIQVLIAIFLQMHPKALGGVVRHLDKINRMPIRQRAVHFRGTMPEETDAQIAAMVGVDRSTLYTWPEYRAAKAMLKRVYTLPMGTVDDDGSLEAWDS